MRDFLRASARGLVTAVLAIAAVVAIPVSAETSAQVTLGLKWLGSQVQSDGALARDAMSIATPMQARSEAIRTLKLSGPVPAVLINKVAAEPDLNTEFLARQVLALRSAGLDASGKVAALLSLQNPDGGFGGAFDYVSNPLDTAFALAALRAGGRMDAPVSKAEEYLLLLQSSEGAFAFDDGTANIQLTALVSSALQSAANNTRLNAAVARANTWLLSMQRADGSWGGVPDTSLVQFALVGTTSDSALQNIISGSILSHQDADGSWAQDPYVTSLALRALMARPGQVANGSEGTIVGKVIASVGGSPIAGATATLTNGGATAVSDAAGDFAFATVAPGSHSVTISAPGYIARRVATDVRTGMISDIGAVALDRSVTGTVWGTVTDAATKLPIAGALIAVSGAANTTAYTLPDGSYNLTGLIPGTIRIAASKPGYAVTQADASIVAGGVLQFSPGLALTATTATLKGRIVDEATALPLAGVAVFAGPGLTAITDADGRFILYGISGGKVDVSLSLSPYATKAFSFLVDAGVNVDIQTITLSKEALPSTTATISGVVRNAADGTPIQGATVKTGGSAPLSAVTAADGSYRLSNVPVGAVTLSAAKAGYVSASASASAAAGVTIIFNPQLDETIAPGITGLVIDSVTKAPLSGVTATLTGNLANPLVVVSDAGGRYRFPGTTGNQLSLALSAPGYATYGQPVNAGPGQLTEIPVTQLAKTSNLLVVSGKVTDLVTGTGIAKTTILILGTPHSAITDAEGNYKMENVQQGAATIKYSAVGYISDTVVVALSPYDRSPHDRALRSGQASSLALDIATDKRSYAAYQPVVIAAQIDNGAAQATRAALSVTILDADGNYINSFMASKTGADGVGQPVFDFVPGVNKVDLVWNAADNVPGSYSAIVRVQQVNAGDEAGSLVELAQKQVAFSIESTAAIESVRLTPLPAFVNLQAVEQLTYRVDIVNRSNVAVESGLTYQLLNPAGERLDSGTIRFSLLPAEQTKSFFVTGGKVTFAKSGLHLSTLTAVDGVEPSTLTGGQISVAPGTRIEPSMTVTPNKVAPDGDKRTRIEIRLQGVEQK